MSEQLINEIVEGTNISIKGNRSKMIKLVRFMAQRDMISEIEAHELLEKISLTKSSEND